MKILISLGIFLLALLCVYGIIFIYQKNSADLHLIASLPGNSDNLDKPPIFLAIERGETARVKNLLETNSTLLNSKWKVIKAFPGYTPLHFAIIKEKKEVAKILISRGADLNAEDAEGSKPLHYAALYGYKDEVELLISKGANVDSTDCRNETPLHLAAMRGHVGIVETLVLNGANVNIMNIYHKTPLKCTLLIERGNAYPERSAGLKGVIEFLRRHGAKE